MFTNPFVFYGRIRRKEYGYSLLGYFFALIFIASQASKHGHSIYLLALFPLFWFRIAQGAKRCHDLGNSGWWQLIPFYVFWLLLEDGKIGPNQYGENPKDNNYPNYTYKGPTGPQDAGNPNY
ncbi:DUF805 domain-containing protein [Mucilaginibacter sp.]|uniref:DUF805 domain-containing protein n=1 Tax=Mucilaginibacter sp. TaxID=1882438 RepID=UPI0032677281